MRKLAVIASLALRHAVATGAVVFAGCVLWTLAYIILFIWAVIVDAGLGSPVVYPIGIVLIVCGVVVASLLLFLPATLVSEIFCRAREWPTLIGIPLTFVIFCALSLFWSYIAGLARPSADISVWALAASLIATMAVPLGLYWWAAQFPLVLWELVGFLRSFSQKRNRINDSVVAPTSSPAKRLGNPGVTEGQPPAG